MDRPIRVLHFAPGGDGPTAAALRETEGIDVVMATAPDEALAAVAEDGFDCVVSAVDPSDDADLELVAALREHNEELPFVALPDAGSTAAASRVVRAAGGEDGTAAHDERRWYEAVIEAIDDAVYVLDGDGRLEYVNESYAEMKGADREELLGTPIDRWVADDVMERTREMIGEVERGERDVGRLEYEFLTADGERIPAELRFSVIEFPDGSRGQVGAIRDVTDQKRRERELRRQNERLDEFASVVSHDLRNPLSIAEGNLELVAAECDSEHLEAVERAHDRMATLIDDLLSLARKGTAVTDVEPVVLADLVESCWRNVDTGDATVDVATTATIRADRSRLKQLVENLVRNSVEHGSTSSRPQAEDGDEHAGEGATITVGDCEDGFYVADDGPGIPESDREKIFEPGFSTSEDGTGFGLAIVKQIAEAHGWTVTAAETDDGARFEFRNVDIEDSGV